MKISLLLILVLLKCVSSQSKSRITVTGGLGTKLTQKDQSNPSEVHIAADSVNSDHNLLIHIEHQRKDDILSPAEKAEAAHVTKMATSLPKPKRHVCQRQMDELISTKREKSIMAIRLTALEIELQKLKKQYQLSQTQRSSNPSSKPSKRSMKNQIELPIIIDYGNPTQYTSDTVNPSSSSEEKQNGGKTNDDKKPDSTMGAKESSENDEQRKNDTTGNTKTQTSKSKTEAKWSKWLILLFIVLLLVPLLIAIFFYCFSKNNETNDQSATFIVGDTGREEENEPQNTNRDIPFMLNQPVFPADGNQYSKESTQEDIKKLSASMNGYLGNSSHPSMSEEVPKSKDDKVESSSHTNPRLSLVDQQVASDEN